MVQKIASYGNIYFTKMYKIMLPYVSLCNVK